MNNDKYEINSIVNYLRKSRRDLDREKRTGEDTLEEQKKLMDKVLEPFGIPYDQRFEVGSGDKISSRPVFSDVLEDLKNGKYDAIAVKEISRLGRGSMSDMGIIYDIITGRLTGKSIYVITPYRVYDPRNSGDQRQIRFEMFFAREEFEMIRERLTGARYGSAMEGKWMGNVPFGYVRNRKTMKLEPIEEEAKIVKLIYQLYLNGIDGKDIRDRAIATYLTRNGIKTPMDKDRWNPIQIKRILTNEAYIGVSKFRTTERMLDGTVRERPKDEHIIVPDAHEPIIEQDVFFQVQNKRENSSAPRAKLDVPTYELTGVVACGVCRKSMSVNRYKRKRKSGDYYAMFLRCGHGCAIINYDVVLDSITNLMHSLPDIDDESLYNLYKSTYSATGKENYKKAKQDLKKSREDKIKELEKRLKFIQKKHFDGIYTDDDYLEFKAEIDEELNLLSKVSESDKEVAVTEEPDLIKTKQEIRNFVDAFDSLGSSEAKNNILRSLFQRTYLTVLQKGTKNKKPEISLEIELQSRLWKFKQPVKATK